MISLSVALADWFGDNAPGHRYVSSSPRIVPSA
jgi:hypothetical protein